MTDNPHMIRIGNYPMSQVYAVEAWWNYLKCMEADDEANAARWFDRWQKLREKDK